MDVEIYIVEDEFIHLEALTLSVNEAGYNLVGSCNNADEAFDKIAKLQPHVVLIDIALPGINNGITLADKIHKQLGIPHIFTTSFIQHQIIDQAVATKPVGYLKKPVGTTNLKAAIEIALNKNPVPKTKPDINNKLLFTKIGDRLVKIPIPEIEYVKADGDNCVSVFFKGREVACRATLKEFQQQLPDNFIQIHRAAIININFLYEINESEQVAIIGKNHLPIGRKYKKLLLAQLKKI